MRELTVERLRDCLAYDPATGVFTWQNPASNKVGVGDVAGTRDKGYIAVYIDDRKHYAHRLAWLYMHGVWPAGDVDHINGVRDDNRLENLREASRSENMGNRGRNANNTSGFKGVSPYRGRWRAQIQVRGHTKSLGTFATPEEAHAVYTTAALAAFGEFAKAE